MKVSSGRLVVSLSLAALALGLAACGVFQIGSESRTVVLKDAPGVMMVRENPPFHYPPKVLFIVPLEYQQDTSCINLLVDFLGSPQQVDEQYWIDGLKVRFDGRIVGESRRFEQYECLSVPFKIGHISIDE